MSLKTSKAAQGRENSMGPMPAEGRRITDFGETHRIKLLFEPWRETKAKESGWEGVEKVGYLAFVQHINACFPGPSALRVGSVFCGRLTILEMLAVFVLCFRRSGRYIDSADYSFVFDVIKRCLEGTGFLAFRLSGCEDRVNRPGVHKRESSVGWWLSREDYLVPAVRLSVVSGLGIPVLPVSDQRSKVF